RGAICRPDRVTQARSADAARHLDREWLRELGKNVLRRIVRAGGRSPGQCDQEFIAADARDLPVWPARRSNAVGCLLEDRVSGRRAEGVVDVLDPVEVDRDQRDGRVTTAMIAQMILDQLEERRPAPQVREHVALRENLDALEGAVPGDDVVEY